MTMNILVGVGDHLDPEVQAMMLAMYSRTYAPIMSRLPDNEESAQQHKERLGKFYVNYGHKSVGQLGSTTIWMEGISQLAAKAVENHALFNGQESSTRYIDYSNQPMYSTHIEITDWQEKFRQLYIKALPIVIEKIKSEFPIKDQVSVSVVGNGSTGNFITINGKTVAKFIETEKGFETTMLEGVEPETVIYKTLNEVIYTFEINECARITKTWENTIKARAFDICRGLLPAGCLTNVGFTGTFDTLNDHFGEMLYHPCQEMREIAESVLTGMMAKYSYGTFSIEKLRERNAHVTEDFFYQEEAKQSSSDILLFDTSESFFSSQVINQQLATRKIYQKINKVSSSRIRMIFRDNLDFGSYRDIHRHRNGVIDMCVLGTKYGFHEFYYDNLTDELRSELAILLMDFQKWMDAATYLSDVEKQYCVPMGYKLPVSYTCDLNQAMYIVERRSDKTVHQTARLYAQRWAKELQYKTRNSVKLHVDMDEDNFTLKRGTQTITDGS